MSGIELQIIEAIDQQAWLDDPGRKLTQAIGRFYGSSPILIKVRDFLHGVWQGHPLHAVITDVTVGSFTAALALDAVELSGRRDLAPGADAALTIGVASAVGAAAAGLTDWHHTSGTARRVGLVHAMLNSTSLVFYIASLVARKRRRRQAGIGLGFAGFLFTLGAGYLGGHLAYSFRIGPNAAPVDEMPEQFTPVIDESELVEGRPQRVRLNDSVSLVMVRRNGAILALAESCAHMGGPLSEGQLGDDDSITCPWHASRFSMRDGRVLQGPAVYAQPCFQTRLNAGKVEVRLVVDENIRQ